ncbi:unnamed protein product, partial [Rotaria sp. Silwood1]
FPFCYEFYKIKRESIGAMTAQTLNKLAAMVATGDYEEFFSELRDGKQTDSFFFGMFPGIQADARAVLVQTCSEKLIDFKVMGLV